MKITTGQMLGCQAASSPNASGSSKNAEGSFCGIDPRTGESLEPSFSEATVDDVDRALQLAEGAADEYANRPQEDRARFLEAIASELELLGDDLVQRASAETGLPEGRIVMERGRTAGQLRMFAQVVREGSYLDVRLTRSLPERTPLPRPDLRRTLIPMGPVVVFGASNFPLAFSVAGGDTASALASGCPVVVKGHPNHPGTSALVAGCIARAANHTKMPSGVFSMVQGKGYAVGAALVHHPLTQAVAFTGSLKGGRALFDLASHRPRPIPVYAEMGSVNPVVLLPGAVAARSEALAQGLQNSVCLGVGQFCTNPGLVFLLKSADSDALVTQVSQAQSSAAAGTMLHAGIKHSYVAGLVRLAHTEGVELISASGEGVKLSEADAVPALAVTSGQTFRAESSLREEVFGPVTLIVVASDMDDLQACLNSLDGQLTATIHAEDSDHAMAQRILAPLQRRAGRLIYNAWPTGVEVCDAMNHGGPYPAATDSRSTSVGSAAIDRFLRPIAWQAFPEALLPRPLQESNPDSIPRREET